MTAIRVKAVAPIALPEDRLAWRAERYRELGRAAGGLDIRLVNLAGPDALKLVGFQLAAVGRMFSAVTRNDVIGRELERKIAEYGLADYFAGVDTIDGDISLVSDEREWMNRLRSVTEGSRAKKAGTIFNGCSAVDVENSVVNGVFILDPTPAALRLPQVAATKGLYRKDTAD